MTMFKEAKDKVDSEVLTLDEKGYVGKNPRPIQYFVNENGCFICTSHTKNRLGYPHIWRNSKQQRMSRYLYTIYYGPILDGNFILHSCDTPSCINPEHLSQGTPKENTQDMIAKGRKPVGSSLRHSKLTEEDVLAILKDPRTSPHVAKDFGVEKSTIKKIRQGKIWAHVFQPFLKTDDDIAGGERTGGHGSTK